MKPGPRFAGRCGRSDAPAPSGPRLPARAAAAPTTTAAATARAVLLETVGAVDRPIAARLEGHLGVLATLGANDRIHLALATVATAVGGAALAGCLARRPASGAAHRGAETLLGEEFLLAGREGEFLAAIVASEGLVLHVVH